MENQKLQSRRDFMRTAGKIALGATALGYTGYLKSLDYARGRPQGRPVGADPA